MVRRALPLTALVVAVVALAGCTPAPEPTPTPTALFASEAEAFAAAEATYRAYVDAVNARRADASSLPAPDEFLIGEALEVELDTQAQLAEEGWQIEGTTSISSLAPDTLSNDQYRATISVCLDSSESRVADASGTDITPPTREPRTPLTVQLDWMGSEYLITSSAVEESIEC